MFGCVGGGWLASAAMGLAEGKKSGLLSLLRSTGKCYLFFLLFEKKIV